MWAWDPVLSIRHRENLAGGLPFLNKKILPRRNPLSLPAFAFFSSSKNMDIRPRNEMKIKHFAKNCGAENQNEFGSRIISCPNLPLSVFFYEIKFSLLS